MELTDINFKSLTYDSNQIYSLESAEQLAVVLARD